MADTEVPSGLDPKIARREVVIEVGAANAGKMRNEARVREYTIVSDEPPTIGGDDEHPYPLDYFVAAAGF